MEQNPFLEGPVDAAYLRLQRLIEGDQELSAKHKALLEQAMQGLSTALEELRIAGEELQQQNEELAEARQLAEEERQRYQDLFEFAPDGYLVTNLEGIIGQANRAAAALLGVRPDFLPHRALISYVAPKDRERFYTYLSRAQEAEAGQMGEWELELVHKGGPSFPAALSVSPSRRGDQVTGLLWLLRDVSDSKRAKERERLLALIEEDRQALEVLTEYLAQERDILRTVMEHTDAQLAYLDAGFRFVRVNEAYARGAGLSREELIGHNHFDLFPDAENHAIFEWVRDTGQVAAFQAKPFTHPDQPGRGTTYWDWTLTPIGSDDGQEVQGLVLSLVDVTDRVRAAEILRQGKREFESLAEHLPDIVARFDRNLRHLYVNPAVERITGLSPEAYLGKTNRELGMPEDLCAFWDKETIEVFQTGQGRTVEFEFGTGEDERHLESRLAPEFGPDDEVVSVLSIVRDITERVHSQEQLELERARLRTIIHNAPEAIVVADRQGRILMTNPTADRLYARPVPYGQGYETHADLLICHPDGTPCEPRQLPLTRAALDGEKIVNAELAIIWPDGQRRDLLASAAPIRDPESRRAGAVGMFQDITERKRTREALERYARRLEALHQIDEAILAAGSAQEIVETALPYARQLVPCARASVSLFDREAGEAVLLGVFGNAEDEAQAGTRVSLHADWPSEELAQGAVRVVDNLQGQNPRTSHMDALLGEGIQAFVNLPLIAEGELIGTLNLGFDAPHELGEEELEIAREMADQLALGIRQAQLQEQVRHHSSVLEKTVARRTAALRSSEARFRTIFEGAAIGIVLVDMAGRIVASNPALQKLLGYSEEELRDKAFADITHPADLGPSSELYAELIEGERDLYALEKRYIRKDGTIRWVRPTVSLIRWEPDDTKYAVKMILDVTEQKQAQQALIRAERLSIAGQLGASLAHEINNPLQSVIGCLGLAEESLVEGGDVSRYLEVAREELRRAARIVTQLRDLHRHSEPDDAVPTDVNALIERVLLLVEKELAGRDVEVVWEGADDLTPVVLVSDRVQQVFLNLVLNAKEAMPGGGVLRIRTSRSREPDGVQITFSDTGTGIASEDLEHIFDAFFSTKDEGLGLGLYVTQRIVQEHEGEISVESTVGEGTTFTVWFPT
jgi:PAS domain S-box-containing protein